MHIFRFPVTVNIFLNMTLLEYHVYVDNVCCKIDVSLNFQYVPSVNALYFKNPVQTIVQVHL